MGTIKDTDTSRDLRADANENSGDKIIRVGDFVEIVGYGHLHWISKFAVSKHVIGIMATKFPVISQDDFQVVFDMQPELVGMRAVVTGCSVTDGKESYALGMAEEGNFKKAWYYRDQLKKVDRL